MTTNQKSSDLEKWRSEFEVFAVKTHSMKKGTIFYSGDTRYTSMYTQSLWLGYLTARRKAQEELEVHSNKAMDEMIAMNTEIQKLREEIDKLKNENKELKKSNPDSVIALRFSLMTNKIKKRDKLLERAKPWLIGRLGHFVSSFTESNQEIIKIRQWLKDYEELN